MNWLLQSCLSCVPVNAHGQSVSPQSCGTSSSVRGGKGCLRLRCKAQDGEEKPLGVGSAVISHGCTFIFSLER